MHRARGRSSGSAWVWEGARASEGLCPDTPGGVYVGNVRRAWGEAVCAGENLAGRCAGISPLSSTGGRVLRARGPPWRVGVSPRDDPDRREVCVGSVRVNWCACGNQAAKACVCS